ncbi:MFS general substrate transporter [Xylariaceae sp. AK1471]|nr:MFS general substrate transporter [Xylariaceae sp. AK1471]
METTLARSASSDKVRDETPETLPSETPIARPIATTEVEYPSAWRQVVIVIGLLLGIFLSIISTAIPAITNEFNSIADAGWYGSAFFLAYAAFQSLWGKAYKYFDMKFVFLASIVVFEVGCLIGGVSPNSAALIVGRVVQGGGAAGILLGCYSIANFVSPPDKVPLIVGVIGSIFSVASVIGPVIGGVFTSEVTWRWCFYVNLPIGAVPVIFILFFFKTPPQAKISSKTPAMEIAISFDPLGTVLFIGALISYILATTWGGIERPWNSSTVIGLLVGWIVLTALFVVNEFWQGERAIIVARLMKKRDMWVNCVYLFFLYGAYFSVVYNLPTYFQATAGLSPRDSGIRTIPIISATTLCSLAASIAVGKSGKYSIFMAVGAAISAVAGGLIYTLDVDTDLGKQIGYQILLGLGIGLVIQIPPIVAGVVNNNADKAIGLGALINEYTLRLEVTQFYSAALIIPASSAITNNLLIQKVPVYAPAAALAEVLAVGPYDLEAHFSGDTLQGIRRAYVEGLRGAWAMGIGLWVVAFFSAFLSKWPGNMIAPQEESSSEDDGQREKVIIPAAV